MEDGLPALGDISPGALRSKLVLGADSAMAGGGRGCAWVGVAAVSLGWLPTGCWWFLGCLPTISIYQQHWAVAGVSMDLLESDVLRFGVISLIVVVNV